MVLVQGLVQSVGIMAPHFAAPPHAASRLSSVAGSWHVAPAGAPQVHEHVAGGAIRPVFPMNACVGWSGPQPGSPDPGPSYTSKYPVHPEGTTGVHVKKGWHLGSAQSA